MAAVGFVLRPTAGRALPDPPAPPSRAAVEAALRVVETVDGESPRPMRVVLLSGPKDHGPEAHEYPRWRERWALLLGGPRASEAGQVNLFGPAVGDAHAIAGAPGVEVLHAENWPEVAHFESADVIAAYGYLPWTDERKRQVRDYLDRGGGLVLIHAATWTRPKADPEVAGLTGVGGFTRYRHGPLDLHIVAHDDPICHGLPPVVPLNDEPYWPPVPPIDAARVKVLASSNEWTSKDDLAPESQPMVWTYETGRGRVFGFVPGHFTWTFDDPWVRILLLRGMAWAAGEPVHRFDTLVPLGARFAKD